MSPAGRELARRAGLNLMVEGEADLAGLDPSVEQRVLARRRGRGIEQNQGIVSPDHPVVRARSRGGRQLVAVPGRAAIRSPAPP